VKTANGAAVMLTSKKNRQVSEQKRVSVNIVS
jgi:hypothetical protein